MPSERDYYNVSLKVFLNNDKGETLILKAREDGNLKGFFDLPGGTIDKDELNVPLNKIIERELLEETGKIQYKLFIKPIALSREENPRRESPLGGPTHWFYIFFEAKFLGGEVEISDEHIGFQWTKLTKENLGGYFTTFLLEGVNAYLENLNNEDKYKS